MDSKQTGKPQSESRETNKAPLGAGWIEQNGPDILLALGGGAARGVAHIGVLRTLIQAGFRIRGIAGTSIGSIFGSAFCAGRLDACEEFARGLGRRGMLRLLDPVMPRSGLFAGKRLIELIEELVGDVRIEDLELPFCAVAADVNTGDEVRITSGRLAHAVRASSGIPGFFNPYSETHIQSGTGQHRWLVDGIVTSPVPVMAARAMGAWPIVAVDVNAPFSARVVGVAEPEPTSAAQPANTSGPEDSREIHQADRDEGPTSKGGRTLMQSILGHLGSSSKIHTNMPKRPSMVESMYSSSMMLQHNFTHAQFRLEPPALVIEPNMMGVNMFDFHMGADLIAEGSRSARAALAAIDD